MRLKTPSRRRQFGQKCSTSWHSYTQNGTKQHPNTQPSMASPLHMSHVRSPGWGLTWVVTKVLQCGQETDTGFGPQLLNTVTTDTGPGRPKIIMGLLAHVLRGTGAVYVKPESDAFAFSGLARFASSESSSMVRSTRTRDIEGRISKEALRFRRILEGFMQQFSLDVR